MDSVMGSYTFWRGRNREILLEKTHSCTQEVLNPSYLKVTQDLHQNAPLCSLIPFGAIYCLFRVTICFMGFELGPESRLVFREFLP